MLVRTVDGVVHRVYGHVPRAVLPACRNRQQRCGLGEVVRFRRHDRRRRHRYLDVAFDNRVQARGHHALTTIFGDAGRGDRQRHPRLGLVLEDYPSVIVEDPLLVDAGCREVQDDCSARTVVVVVIRGGQRDHVRAVHRPGGYGQRAVGAQREVVGRRRVIRVRFVDTDRYGHLVGQRLVQVRGERAGATLEHLCRRRRHRHLHIPHIVIIDDNDLGAVVDAHELAVVGRRSSEFDDLRPYIGVLQRSERHHARAVGLSRGDHEDRIRAQLGRIVAVLNGHGHVGRNRLKRVQGDRADLAFRYRRRCRHQVQEHLPVIFENRQRPVVRVRRAAAAGHRPRDRDLSCAAAATQRVVDRCDGDRLRAPCSARRNRQHGIGAQHVVVCAGVGVTGRRGHRDRRLVVQGAARDGRDRADQAFPDLRRREHQSHVRRHVVVVHDRQFLRFGRPHAAPLGHRRQNRDRLVRLVRGVVHGRDDQGFGGVDRSRLEGQRGAAQHGPVARLQRQRHLHHALVQFRLERPQRGFAAVFEDRRRVDYPPDDGVVVVDNRDFRGVPHPHADGPESASRRTNGCPCSRSHPGR